MSSLLNDLNILYNNVLTACIDASECIPKSNPSGKDTSQADSRNIPGWTDKVEHLRREALMWHHHWKACNQPHHGFVAEMHRISRASYHRSVREVFRE